MRSVLKPSTCFRRHTADWCPCSCRYSRGRLRREICAPECLTFTNTIDDAPAEFLEQLNKYHHAARYTSFPTLTLSLQFEEQAEKTRLALRTCFASNSERDAFIKLGYPEGMAESLEKHGANFRLSLPSE